MPSDTTAWSEADVMLSQTNPGAGQQTHLWRITPGVALSLICLLTANLPVAAQTDSSGEPISRTRKSIVVDRPCGQVWPLVADFSGISTWFKGFRSSKRVAGQPGRVGEVRELVRASNGQIVQEKLIYLDPVGLELGYTHVMNGPVRDNVALVSLVPLVQGQCLVSWSNTFRPKTVQDGQQNSTFFQTAYLSVLENLKQAAEKAP